MTLRSNVAPSALRVALIIAGVADVFDTAAFALDPNYADHEALFTAIVAAPAVVAEAALVIWLLRVGRRSGQPSPHPTEVGELVAV